MLLPPIIRKGINFFRNRIVWSIPIIILIFVHSEIIYGDYRIFFTRLPNYLHDNISYIWNFVPGFLGVFLGFTLNRYWSYYNDTREIYRILPLIELELRENIKFLSRVSGSSFHFQRDQFDTNYWEIYKTQLADWWGNIIQLSEIYGLIDRIGSNNAANKDIVFYLKKIIPQYLIFLEDWYKDQGQGGGKAGRRGRLIKKMQLERYLEYDFPEDTLNIVKMMYKVNEENVRKLDL